MASEYPDQGRQGLAVSNAIARLHREHYGRGGSMARTIINRDYVVCFLTDIYTPVERTLIEADREDQVKETRQVFQMAMREAFSAAVEQIMGRRVIAFMSQVHFDPDMCAELFVLEPTTNGGATRSDAAGAPTQEEAQRAGG